MDSARDRHTGEIIDAEMLWDMEEVDRDAYECSGCKVQVFPASFKKDVNKRRPYFRLGDNKHVKPCGIDGVEKLVQKAKKAGVGRPDGFPVPYPTKLLLSDTRPVTTGAGAAAGGATGASVKSRAPSTRDDGYHGHTVRTIRPVCRIFMEYPHDRDQLDIEIPGCPGSTYSTVFSKLDFQGIRSLPVPMRLFYAALRWGSPTETDEYIEWLLDAGTWVPGAKRPESFYRARIQWSSWTERQRTTLRHELEIARNDVKGKTDQPEKAWLFFVGRQDLADPSLLVVDRYQLVCCRVGEMIWPKRR